MVQRLYPQCQSCWLSQGSAVRQNIHKIVYHHRLHLFHFAPVAALLSMEREDLRQGVDCAIDSVSNLNIRSKFIALKKKYIDVNPR